MKKLPPITIIIGIILLIGGLIFVWQYADKESLIKVKLGGKTIEVSKEDLKDSDNDGLKDWEEELFGTDPYNPDTDADGYLDGEEVAADTNPLIKAPGDKLVFYPLPVGEKYNITKKILDEEVIDSMLDSYTFQKGEYIMDHPEIYSPETFSAFTKQSTIQTMSKWALSDAYAGLLEKAEQTISEIPELFNIKITDENIKISQDNSLEAIKLYLSQISSVLNSDIFFLQEQTLQAVLSAFKNNDFSYLDKLIKSNDAKIEQVKNIIVPSSWKEIHKQGLELTLLIRNIFVSLRDMQNDPLKAYVALEKLENFSDDWNDLMNQAIDLAKGQGIKLSL